MKKACRDAKTQRVSAKNLLCTYSLRLSLRLCAPFLLLLHGSSLELPIRWHLLHDGSPQLRQDKGLGLVKLERHGGIGGSLYLLVIIFEAFLLLFPVYKIFRGQ